jgi:multipile epidermal growth factor-like domains protein 8
MSEAFVNLSRSEIEAKITEGAKSNAFCINCANQTDGSRCESCIPGFFRGTTNLKDTCKKCQCNGHGDNCDPLTGEKCNCADNSENDNTCPAKLDKNSIYRCSDGCSKCKESYSGHPKNAHQCYKIFTIDSKMCLDAKPLDECRIETIPLQEGKTVFFVIQPRFMNVDIRIILDVTQGEVDFLMASNDDSFVVLTNHSNGLHEILLDSRYQWIQRETGADNELMENLNITPLVTSSKKSFDNVSIPHGFTEDRGTHDCKFSGKFHVLDKVAHSLSTHITLQRCNTLLRVFSLKNRLVVTLPQNVHNLSVNRFYIALRAANHAKVTGLLFFR